MNLEEIIDSEENNDNEADGLVSNAHAAPLFTSENMDILNDIDMQIIVEIGRAKMKISDLLNLKKGAIIELAQTVDDPLKIYANDKLIAKGMIVSTNGKYCIKIM